MGNCDSVLPFWLILLLHAIHLCLDLVVSSILSLVFIKDMMNKWPEQLDFRGPFGYNFYSAHHVIIGIDQSLNCLLFPLRLL